MNLNTIRNRIKKIPKPLEEIEIVLTIVRADGSIVGVKRRRPGQPYGPMEIKKPDKPG